MTTFAPASPNARRYDPIAYRLDGLVSIGCNEDALSGGKAVRFDDVRGAELIHERNGLVDLVEDLPASARHACRCPSTLLRTPSIPRYGPRSRSGPKTLKPSPRRASPTPATSGASGPTITRSTFTLRAQSRPRSPVQARPCRAPRRDRAMPGLPGAANTLVTEGERASAHASALSRPPEPITRTLTGTSLT